eukprot:TRINITY_DN10346_c0_g1_i1.p1 TRINITY_DN10346_c0_g1~~TRINITY_DN10346_c0_g1_i1.p1  ORF type:complete len:701 (+),score=79.55 TRINITY_DN10346_c0_g1_i1:64-2103(+)
MPLNFVEIYAAVRFFCYKARRTAIGGVRRSQRLLVSRPALLGFCCVCIMTCLGIAIPLMYGRSARLNWRRNNMRGGNKHGGNQRASASQDGRGARTAVSNALGSGYVGAGAFGVAAIAALALGEDGSDTDVDAVFVTDCTEYQEWMTQVFLSRWRLAGPTAARLTRILSCATDDPRLPAVLARAASQRDVVDIFQLPELNGEGSDRYLCNNRPRGIRRWLKARPPRSPHHWVVMLDPDMLLLRPLDVSGAWRVAGGALADGGTARDGAQSRSWTLAELPESLGLSHNFKFVGRAFINANLSLSKLCAIDVEVSSSGRRPVGVERSRHRGISASRSKAGEIEEIDVASTLRGCHARLRPFFEDSSLIDEAYAVGVPHFIRARDLAKMADAWEVMTNRVRQQYKGWTAEMHSWILAARLSGIRFGYLAEVVSDPSSTEPAWDGFDAGAGGDVCDAPFPDETAGDIGVAEDATANTSSLSTQTPQLPWLIHYCEIYNVSYSSKDGSPTTMYLDKRMIKKSLRESDYGKTKSGDGSLLDCAAPLFEVPPRDLLSRPLPAAVAPGAAQTLSRFRRSSWFLCTTLHSINNGLRQARRWRPASNPSAELCDVDASPEVLRAAPLAAQVAEMFAKTAFKASTVNWEERLKQTRSRMGHRRDGHVKDSNANQSDSGDRRGNIAGGTVL